MGNFNSYDIIIIASLVIILSFFFGELSKKTNIPSVLMLIFLGIGLKLGMKALHLEEIDFFPILELLGIVGLIMIVLEAALELELKREKLWPILKAFGIALVGLLASTWVAAIILEQYVEGMTTEVAWIYATPLSILSSAIIIPSVNSLSETKKEFHIYESTFSDIMGIMLFYFLVGQVEHEGDGSGVAAFLGNTGLTIAVSFLASYILIFIFQKISSHAKLFLLISVLLLLYALGKKMHLSSLIIILIFGLLIGNMQLFFKGRLSKWLHLEKAKHIYEDLHVITIETAFVVRTFFFVIFGLTIALDSLLNVDVAIISALILVSIYVIRFITLRITLGSNIIPQLFIAPRGLITVLLFYAIPKQVEVENFEAGILLFIIMATSIIMTIAMVYDKRRNQQALNKANGISIGYSTWKAPSVEEKEKNTDA
ncbi:MAG: cell volume regulation protein A [Aureispira sp.]|jgi:cell volume regulation protein A